MVSAPRDSSRDRSSASEYRETAYTVRSAFASSLARTIRPTSDGPIFPAAPRTMTSPSSAPAKSTSSGYGSASASASSVSVVID